MKNEESGKGFKVRTNVDLGSLEISEEKKVELDKLAKRMKEQFSGEDLSELSPEEILEKLEFIHEEEVGK